MSPATISRLLEAADRLEEIGLYREAQSIRCDVRDGTPGGALRTLIELYDSLVRVRDVVAALAPQTVARVDLARAAVSVAAQAMKENTSA